MTKIDSPNYDFVEYPFVIYGDLESQLVPCENLRGQIIKSIVAVKISNALNTIKVIAVKAVFSGF